MLRGRWHVLHSSGTKRIRVHDLRHSHVSMLIQMGFSMIVSSKHSRYPQSEGKRKHVLVEIKEEVMEITLANSRKTIEIWY